MVDFKDRVAVVTGAGAGLGRSHAKLLASLGAKVVVNDPGGAGTASAAADAVVKEIVDLGGTAVANHASVADREGAASIIQTAIDRFGKIDVVVNNAGILRDRSFAKMSLDDFELVLQVHLMGTVYVTKAAWPYMLDQKYGRIVLTTSGSGLSASYGQANYGSAKAGMLGLMNNLKNEGEKANIKVNMISPIAGTVMTQGILDQKLFDLSKPEQVSPAVAWLASEACNLTGEVIAAGAGFFASVKLFKSEGVVFDKAVTVEDFAGAVSRIFDAGTYRPYGRTLDDKTMQALGLA